MALDWQTLTVDEWAALAIDEWGMLVIEPQYGARLIVMAQGAFSAGADAAVVSTLSNASGSIVGALAATVSKSQESQTVFSAGKD